MTRATRNIVDNVPQLIGRRTFLAATIAAAAAASAACGFGDDGSDNNTSDEDDANNSGGGSEPQRGGTLRQSMIPVTHLDPAVSGNSSFGQIMMIGLWEGLVVIDADDPSQVLPGVAESWDISNDGLTYTFHLRSDATWSNGDPVTVSDFEWNWKRILTPGIAGEGAPSFNASTTRIVGAGAYMNGETTDFTTVGVTALDDATFELTLEEPNPDFLIHLAGYWALPLHPATVEELGEAWLDPENWVSNGAYVLDSFRVNQGAVLLPNEHYWDADSYYLDRWEVTFNDGGTTADLLAYQQGEIDITGRIEDDLEAVTTSDVADELMTSPTNQVRRLIVMNSKNPALHDVRVRQALAMSIDREALAGVAKPAVAGNSLVPSAVPEYDQVPGIEYNVDQAQSLLQDAGYADGEGMPTVSLLDFQQSPWVEAIAQMWRENLNINVELDIVEIGVYVEKRDAVHPEDYTGFYIQNGAINPPTFLATAQSAIPGAPTINGTNLVPPEIGEDVLAAQENGTAPADVYAMIEGNRHPELEECVTLLREAIGERDEATQNDLLIQASTAWNETYTLIPVLWGGYNLLVKPRVQNLKPWIYPTIFTTKGVTIDG
ncbi:peptide ABC transporter substrate-binding protein [Phytoactinopolyspora alkaliphila]|uniref:Peptide ABC transporter substrate-binding protein n=1 Tax=Phytoactinopolyspora alkaliphila TaxID=1783498 RepID=A0A6N9YSU4_9ACTN|nr:peptide ABC transporter substrate-binding protein [Phytoactinopolyspora alkaliphila]NED97879.1 peptide ABC transporter substrate-binding protein [Phytoactinopolyspora alkaliphila]